MPAPAASAVRWLREDAWPLWLAHGVDWEQGAFHEHLHPQTLACAADFRRLRVATRQTYVFAKAAAHGVPRAADAVALGLDFLRGPARLDDGGYAWRFDLANQPTDRTRDLYDHAFVLLAFAAAAPVVGAETVRPEARALLDYIDTRLRHPEAGYEEAIPPSRPRRQNPHMHLLEALLAAHDAFGDPVYLARARDLVDLFLDRLFQPREGALPEYFDEQLSPQREANGLYVIEPGHHYEWVWLIDWYTKSAAAAAERPRPELAAAASEALLRFADRFALDRATGLVINELWSDGSVRAGGFRLWPQTERLKAELRRPNGGAEAATAAFTAFQTHIHGAHPGLWHERINPDRTPAADLVPATSLYHLTAALTDPLVLAYAGYS